MGVIKQRPRTAIDAAEEDASLINDILRAEETGPDISNDENEIDGGNRMPSVQRISLIRVRRTLRTRIPAIPQDQTLPPKSNRRGSKKLRRYENQIQLTREYGDDQEFCEVSIEDFLPSAHSRSAFAKLLQQADAELWNRFINPKEEPQDLSLSDGSTKTNIRNSHQVNQDPEEAFGGICRKLRNILKRRHFPLGAMEMLEESVMEFFENRPQDTFESLPLDAFRRGMLHALSQYNNLRSHSIKSKNQDKHKQVLIQNENGKFSPPSLRLVPYLEMKYHTTKE